MSESRLRWTMATLAAGVFFATLSMPASASAACFQPDHIDFELGLRGINCDHWDPAEETWTVPAQITKQRFVLRGADDPSGGTGGVVEATLRLKAGDVITLKVGSEGAASSVSRGAEVLLVAGGGDGAEPNFVSPEAEAVESLEPGGPLEHGAWNGRIDIRWYDAREPFDLDEPLPPNSVEFPGAAVATFSYTGAWQEWTVPDGINRVAFDLYGGAGTSGEPYGHIVVGFSVMPGRSFDFFVGGSGDDTAWGQAFLLAAGGDTERPNYLGFGDGYLRQTQFWEGGGPGSQAGEGKALVYYWWEPEPSPPSPDPPLDPPGPGPVPPAAQAELCVVPRLKNRTARTARRQLTQASCAFGKVIRRPTGTRLRGRVIRQRPSPGAVIPAARAVHLIVGR